MCATNARNQDRCQNGLLLPVLLVLIAAACGCRSLSPKSAVPESVMTCRQLSQQATSQMEQGRWQEAESLLAQAINACPTNAEARRRYAKVLHQRGELGQAVEQLDKALETERNAETLVHAGELHLARGQTDLAMWRAEQALSEDATFGAAWALRGRVQANLGDMDQALADLHRSLDYDRKNVQVQLEVAEIYTHRRQPRQVLATLQHLFENSLPEESPSRVWFLQGLAYQSLGHYGDAVNSLSAACRDTQDSQALYHLGHAQVLAGQRLAAESSLVKALNLDRAHPPSLALLRQLRTETAGQPVGNRVR